MKVVVQRVRDASVSIDGEVVGQIERGLLLLIGIAQNDTEEDIRFVADKCVNLRIFEDSEGKMNRSLLETGGDALAISQFTLLGDTRKGRRPSFIEAAPPDKGKYLYDKFVNHLKTYPITVECGVFGAMMDVRFTNYGPVTLLVESKNVKKATTDLS
ncbi:MAG TPA: D-tyrosyl-tRNA(Tyr) deacylase [Calditrichaeota bacterium]|nr:D-tyrosyl-tRNA(Tyr) deacylase [Calditrichota bacterium]